jgi:hypothetical protein
MNPIRQTNPMAGGAGILGFLPVIGTGTPGPILLRVQVGWRSTSIQGRHDCCPTRTWLAWFTRVDTTSPASPTDRNHAGAQRVLEHLAKIADNLIEVAEAGP